MYTSHNFMRLVRVRRGLVFGVIIITALFAFEIFNYSTTEHALSDLLGELDFAGIRWATILAIAFCGIDFAGIARLFSPDRSVSGAPAADNESWYLFGAWFLAATMNAMLTWWGVSLAVLGHQTLGNEVVGRETLLRVVPVFVAVLVWLIRVLMIGTFSVAGERLFTQAEDGLPAVRRSEMQPRAFERGSMAHTPALRPSTSSSVSRAVGKATVPMQAESYVSNRPEPTYHSMSAGSTQAGKSTTAVHGLHAREPRQGPSLRS